MMLARVVMFHVVFFHSSGMRAMVIFIRIFCYFRYYTNVYYLPPRFILITFFAAMLMGHIMPTCWCAAVSRYVGSVFVDVELCLC